MFDEIVDSDLGKAFRIKIKCFFHPGCKFVATCPYEHSDEKGFFKVFSRTRENSLEIWLKHHKYIDDNCAIIGQTEDAGSHE